MSFHGALRPTRIRLVIAAVLAALATLLLAVPIPVRERMFRHEPAVLLYAPLHIVIWGDPGGPGYLTFDRPSDQFGSFGDAEVSKVGVELDGKLAVLLEHLGVSVPDELRTT